MSSNAASWPSACDQVEAIVRALHGRRHGREWRCCCPAHNDHDPSLAVAEVNGKVLIRCRAGCSKDAVFHELRRLGLWGCKRPVGASQGCPCAPDSTAPRDPMKSWRNASAFVRLRFSPALWHWPSRQRWPAMLAAVATADGEEIGCHQTFLEFDGSRKAPLGDKARLFAAGGRTIGAGVWFGEANPNSEFIVAEGLESLVSALRIYGVTAGCAALSELGDSPAGPAGRGAQGAHFR